MLTFHFTCLICCRDPPGGKSKVTVTQGTEITFSLSIEGMQAWDNSLEKETVKDKGENEDGALCEGFGVMECNVIDHVERTHKTTKSALNLVEAERSTDSHYDFTFEFKYEFSTSTNPRTAGMPSDVIIGGGLDIIVSDIIQGKY